MNSIMGIRLKNMKFDTKKISQKTKTYIITFIALLISVVCFAVLQANVDFDKGPDKNIFIEKSNLINGETLSATKIIKIDLKDDLTANFEVDGIKLPATSTTLISSTKEYSILLPSKLLANNHILKIIVLEDNNRVVYTKEISFKLI